MSRPREPVRPNVLTDLARFAWLSAVQPLVRATVLLWLLALASVSRAEQDPDSATTSPTGSTPTSASTQPGEATAASGRPKVEADAAAELYDLAFEALAHDHPEQTVWLLTQLRAQHPEHRLAAQADEILRALSPAATPSALAARSQGAIARAGSAPQVAAQTEAKGGRAGNGAARAELVFFQTLHGVALGAEVCAMLECDGTRPWVVSVMAGAGAGLALSLQLSRDGVSPGLARALTAGTEWGAWNALMIGLGTGAFENAHREGPAIGPALMLGQLAGLGAGGLLYWQLQPSAGQVSLTSSGGIWTTVMFDLSMALFDVNASSRTVAYSLLAASDLGLLAGGFLAHEKPMSASRVLMIDAGGIVGVLSGAGIALLFSGDNPKSQVIAGASLLGTLAGLGIAYHLTRAWDDGDGAEAPKLSLGILPAPGGALGTARWLF